MEVIDRRIVAAYIVSSDNKLLLGRKDPDRGGVYPDCWHIPGGGVDQGETDEQAVRREVLEETDLDLDGAIIELIDDQGTDEAVKSIVGQPDRLNRMQFNIFKISLPKPASEIAVTDKDDLINLSWYSAVEVAGMKLTPPSDALLNRIGRDWLFSKEQL